ncbi:MAG: hypothetical protein QOE40_145 [Actinomycetota bacterium]|nr:hypothetical protein [Actinomycetota bacterium]
MSRIVEKGEVFFFYRPRVGLDEVRDLADVQRFFFVIEPDAARRFRRIVVGRKRLPDPLQHERVWAYVAEVADDPAQLRDELERQTYETRTRGLRLQPEARPAGEGRYAIVEHHRHSHLAYVLEIPREPGPAQLTFRILREASYVVAVRNPTVHVAPGAGLRPGRRATYPPALLERFGERRFLPLDDPAFLDYVGTELVLIGAAADVDAELDDDIGNDIGEGLREDDDLEADEASLDNARIFLDLRIGPDELPTEPLERGELR